MIHFSEGSQTVFIPAFLYSSSSYFLSHVLAVLYLECRLFKAYMPYFLQVLFECVDPQEGISFPFFAWLTTKAKISLWAASSQEAFLDHYHLQGCPDTSVSHSFYYNWVLTKISTSQVSSQLFLATGAHIGSKSI